MREPRHCTRKNVYPRLSACAYAYTEEQYTSTLSSDNVWKAKLPYSNSRQNDNPPTLNPSDQTSRFSPVRLSTWNCSKQREPYIHQLVEDGCDIIAIIEHWLCPFESEQLQQIHPSFTAEVKIDNRLNENSSLSWGCGGVGLMWRKSLNATPISSISSDRICGLHIKLSQSGLNVFGVYLP